MSIAISLATKFKGSVRHNNSRRQNPAMQVGEPCICRLSHVLESLQDVRTLSLANNSLTSLPDAVWKLNELISLDLAGNLLVSIPAEAARMKSLKVGLFP